MMTTNKNQTMKPCVIHWFRKGLRFHDNPALLAAVNYSNENNLRFMPIFILDPDYHNKIYKIGANRWNFLHQSLTDLDEKFRNLHNNRLHVIQGASVDVISKLITDYNVKCITFEIETEPYAKIRDQKVVELCKKLNVEVVTKFGHTLWNSDDVLEANNGVTPITYQSFLSTVTKLEIPDKPLEMPMKIPELEEDEKLLYDKNCYKLPELEELAQLYDFKMEDIDPENKYPGGETEALKRLDQNINLKKSKWVREFSKPDTSPISLNPSTTVLSPHLMHGTLSCRTFYWRLQEIYQQGPHTKPPQSLVGQLIWRDFFICCGATIKNFNQMEGNIHCKQIDWDDDEEKFNQWKNAQTGFPIIDAILTQLKNEGWIHHIARHIVACFLTRGDLWQSWEKGMKHFEEKLLDADWSLNAANWQWLSASCFFYQYNRVYSPIYFGRKHDRDGKYIRKYLPVLAKMPSKYIYEPWNAPLKVQKDANCIIGKDYPSPMVDHEVVSKLNIERMKENYKKPINQNRKPPKMEKSSKNNYDPKPDEMDAHEKFLLEKKQSKNPSYDFSQPASNPPTNFEISTSKTNRRIKNLPFSQNSGPKSKKIVAHKVALQSIGEGYKSKKFF